MSRLFISQWFTRQGGLPGDWVRNARCSKSLHLPWMGALPFDGQPDPLQRVQMVQICADCPVRIECADHALKQPGGFYAGIWLPWRRQASSESKEQRKVRLLARSDLKRIADLVSA